MCMKHCRGAAENVMTPTVSGFSISVQKAAGYKPALSSLREQLKRHGFEILCEFGVNSALEREMGLSWEHLGVPWQNYTVLVVWNPREACHAVASDRDGGLLVPFNVCVAGNGRSTVAAVINHYGALMPRDGPIGIRLVIRNLTREIYEVLQAFGNDEETPLRCETERVEAHMW